MSETRFYRGFYTVIRPVAAVIYPMKLHGLENIPEGGALVCANHSAALDPIFVACALKKNHPLRPMAKESLMKVPVLGWFLKKMGCFGVARGESDIGAIKYALGELKKGRYVLLFPEGTRITCREEGEPKTGAAMLASRAGVPVLPVYVPFRKKLFRMNHVYVGKPLTLIPEGKRATSQDYKRFTDEIMDAIYGCGDGK